MNNLKLISQTLCPHCGKDVNKPQSNSKSEAVEVLLFLNTKANKRFRPVETNLKLIKARLTSGIEVGDLKAIVAKKVRDWVGTDMEAYLRPATLFNATKCEQYLGELDSEEE